MTDLELQEDFVSRMKSVYKSCINLNNGKKNSDKNLLSVFKALSI
jgi:hypothetical protein